MKLPGISILAALALSFLFIGGCAVSPQQRTGLVTLNGQPITLLGHPAKVGEKAPTFKAVANNMTVFHFHPGRGKVWILSSVPSLDTPVCSLETRHFNLVASTLGKSVGIITISMDLPFAQTRWCGASGANQIRLLSDHRDAAFGTAYGVLIKEWRLLARAVFVVDRQGTLQHVELVPEVSREPDYEATLAAVAQLRPK